MPQSRQATIHNPDIKEPAPSQISALVAGVATAEEPSRGNTHAEQVPALALSPAPSIVNRSERCGSSIL